MTSKEKKTWAPVKTPLNTCANEKHPPQRARKVINAMKKTVAKPLGLYLHIPFCASKCAYCDFYSFVPQDEEIQKHYVSAMLLQIEDFAPLCREYTVDSVFIGGGTPSILPPKLLNRLIDAVWRNFSLTDDVEITLEANPATVSYKNLRRLHRAGVSRLSMGLQSAHARSCRRWAGATPARILSAPSPRRGMRNLTTSIST